MLEHPGDYYDMSDPYARYYWWDKKDADACNACTEALKLRGLSWLPLLAHNRSQILAQQYPGYSREVQLNPKPQSRAQDAPKQRRPIARPRTAPAKSMSVSANSISPSVQRSKQPYRHQHKVIWNFKPH